MKIKRRNSKINQVDFFHRKQGLWREDFGVFYISLFYVNDDLEGEVIELEKHGK